MDSTSTKEGGGLAAIETSEYAASFSRLGCGGGELRGKSIGGVGSLKWRGTGLPRPSPGAPLTGRIDEILQHLVALLLER